MVTRMLIQLQLAIVTGGAAVRSYLSARVERRATATEGQAFLEYALILPILLCLAFAVVGAGRVVQAQLGVSAVAREAARAGVAGRSPGRGGRGARRSPRATP